MNDTKAVSHSRAEFERWISSPPYEKDTER